MREEGRGRKRMEEEGGKRRNEGRGRKNGREEFHLRKRKKGNKVEGEFSAFIRMKITQNERSEVSMHHMSFVNHPEPCKKSSKN